MIKLNILVYKHMRDNEREGERKRVRIRKKKVQDNLKNELWKIKTRKYIT